jgi:flagellar FliL protein
MPDTDDASADGGQGGGRKKKLIVIIAVVALLGGAAYFFLKPGGDAAATPGAPSPKPSHAPGPVVQLDAITINLAGGHYLKLGMALQASTSVGEEGLSGAKALDAAIGLFSNMSVDELADPKGREHAKQELVTEISELYEDEVYDIYFTEFVMQ